jgi:hypothetical protein
MPVELHRFFHGWRDDEGFTAFVNTAGCALVDRATVMRQSTPTSFSIAP